MRIPETTLVNDDHFRDPEACESCGIDGLANFVDSMRRSRLAGLVRPDAEFTGELLGTFLLVFFGLGAVHVAVLADGLVGLWQVAAVWGIAVGVAIYATASLSGAHLNPAITVALAVFRGFAWPKVTKYVLAQVAGAFLAAAALYMLFGGLIERFEQDQAIVRGAAGSERSAMIYGEYFPNPAMFGGSAQVPASFSVFHAMTAEGAGTALLAFIVFAASAPRGSRRPTVGAVAICVGLGLAMIISVFAPLTQAGFNPARDFGPRLFSYLAGWGSVAIPGPQGGFFTVYILGPVLGAVFGGGIHVILSRMARAEPVSQRRAAPASTPVVAPVPSIPPRSAVAPLAVANARCQLVLVGGFLGAGKTTLLKHLADRFRNEGLRVGLVTNDEGRDLVDTSILEASHRGAVREVSGGCFCCRFPDLVEALGDLTSRLDPNVILCEPVGSCTDISATVLQPLKKLHRQQYRLAPFTVLLDPQRTIEALDKASHASLPDHVLYILRKQIEEADLLVINKADMASPETLDRCRTLVTELVPNTPVLTMSAASGAGVDAWFERLAALGVSGQRITPVDYDQYARGEAALGFLNANLRLAAGSPVNWQKFADQLLRHFQQQLRSRPVEIAHVKFRLATGQDTVAGNLTGTTVQPAIRGRLDRSRQMAQILFNARVLMAPDHLRSAFEHSLAEVAAGFDITAETMELHGFAPPRPRPTHRFASVVSLS
jgi:glycerol uptake facilitator protein